MVNETVNATDSSITGFVEDILRGVLSKYIVAILILLVGFILGKLLGKLVQKLLNIIELDALLRRATGVKLGLEEIMGHFISYFIYFISIVMALDYLGLKTWILNFISFAIIALIVLSIVLGVKDFIPNVFAGLFLHRRRHIKEGETIEFDGTRGKVVHVNLVETRIETKGGDIIYIPNSFFVKTALIKKVTKGHRKGKA